MMNQPLFIFLFTCLLIVLQPVSLYYKLRHGKNLFYLVLICSVFWGGICYFFYGFPLDEGTAPEKELPVLERNFGAAAALLLISAIDLMLVSRKER